MADTPRHIAVVALRRSGTTALWNLLRQDTRYTCYDEPFSKLLHDLPAENAKRTRAEFIALYRRDPGAFRDLYAPIPREEEVTSGLSDRQVAYLRYLQADGPTAIDVTRCTGKIPALHSVSPDAVLVHLYRHPIAFASSHLLPSDSFDPFGLRGRWNRSAALRRVTGFNGWGMEELARKPWVERTNKLFEPVGVQLPASGKKIAAAQRLLGLWLGAYRLARLDGREHFGDRFLSIGFEDFCMRPGEHLGKIYSVAGTDAADIDTSGIRRASSGLLAKDPRWRTFAENAGFSADELHMFFNADNGRD